MLFIRIDPEFPRKFMIKSCLIQSHIMKKLHLKHISLPTFQQNTSPLSPPILLLIMMTIIKNIREKNLRMETIPSLSPDLALSQKEIERICGLTPLQLEKRVSSTNSRSFHHGDMLYFFKKPNLHWNFERSKYSLR